MKKFLAILITVCFGLFFQQNVFADSTDYVYVWDWATHPAYELCGGTSGRNCSDYSYVIFEPSGTCTDSAASFYVQGVGSFAGNSLISVCSKIIAPINLPYLSLTGGRYLDARYSGSVTVTLTDDIASCNCPEPEEPEPCPDPETPPFVQIVVDAFWKYHVAFAAAVPAILVIFLVYRLIKGRLR